MKLYHCPDARSLRPLWALEELGLEYELIKMEFPPRYTHEDFTEINPLGTVPAFIDGGLLMTESTGICQYLVDKYGPSEFGISVDEPEYGEYLNWLHRSDATLTFPQTIVLRYAFLEPEERRLPQAVEDYSKWFLARLESVEDGIEDKEFLVGGRFTIADIAVYYALFLGRMLGLEKRYKSNVLRYMECLERRPALKRVLEKQS